MGLRFSQHSLQERCKRRLYRRAKREHRSTIIYTDVKEVYNLGRKNNTPPTPLPSPAIQRLLTLHPTSEFSPCTPKQTRRKPRPIPPPSQQTLAYFLQPNTNNSTQPSHAFHPSVTKVPNSCTRRRKSTPPPSPNPPLTQGDIPEDIPAQNLRYQPSLHGTRYTPNSQDKATRTALHKRKDFHTLIGGITSTRWPNRVSDLLRLLPVSTRSSLYLDGWLSDTNISTVSELYNLHSPPPGSPGSYLAIDGLFFSLLYTSDHSFTYDRVRTWFPPSSTHSPLHYDTLYIPTNLSGQHWTGLIIDFTKHHVMYYDSLGDINYSSRVLYYIKCWLHHERQHLLQHNYLTEERAASIGDPDLWTFQINPPGSPQQTNGYDCGIFYLTTILYHIQGRALKYTQQHIPLIRQQLVAAILSGSIPNPHVPLSIYDNPYASLPFCPTAHRLLLSISSPQVPDSVYTPNTTSSPIDLTHDDSYELDFILHGGGFLIRSPLSTSPHAHAYNLHHLYYPP